MRQMSDSPYLPSATTITSVTSVREVRLETPRLVLREYRADDVDAVLAYAGDATVMHGQSQHPATREQVARNLAQLDAQRLREPCRLRYELAIVRKDEDRPIGWLPLLLSDAEHPDAEVGWTLVQGAWGQGFATEAARAVLPFAFETLRLHRVWARCQRENRASMRVMGLSLKMHLSTN